MATIKGGSKLKSFFNRLSNKLGKAKTLRVGFLEGSTAPDGTSMPMIAAIQNFGAPKVNIPPRPFFTNMVKDKSPGWPVTLGNLLRANNYNARDSLNKMGNHVDGQLRESILDTHTPPLSPITVMLRGMRSNNPSLVVTGKTVGEAAARVAAGKTNYGASTKPLIDRGNMLDAVSHEIKE